MISHIRGIQIAFLYALKRIAKPLGWKNPKLKLICEKKKCSLT